VYSSSLMSLVRIRLSNAVMLSASLSEVGVRRSPRVRDGTSGRQGEERMERRR
jgi:hypothetical protein